MIENKHIDQEDLALYAMHLLPDAETKTIEAHLAECEGCSEAAALVRGDMAALAMTAEMQSPPAAARQRLMTQVMREKKTVPIDRAMTAQTEGPLSNRALNQDTYVPTSSSASKIIPWVSWVGWAVAAGLTFTVFDLYQERDDLRAAVAKQAGEMQAISAEAQRGRALVQALTDQNAMRVTLNQTPGKAVPQGRATYLAEKGSLVFIANNLAPLQPYKTYELWILPSDGKDPVPAGTFQPDARGNASLILPAVPKGVVAKAFAITIEDEGGSSTPTMPIILSGA